MPETTIHPPVSNPDNNVDTGTLQVNVTANTGFALLKMHRSEFPIQVRLIPH